MATNNVVRVFPLNVETAPVGAVLGHVRATRDHAFATDSAYGAIIIIDRATGHARRVLSKHPKTQADTSITPIVDGEPFQKANGEPIVVHANLLEIIGDWFYFTCLFGPILRRIKLFSILDSTLTNADLGSLIEDVARIPPCAGLMRASDGRLYISAFSENAILCLDQDGLHTVIRSPRLCFPNEGSVGPDDLAVRPRFSGQSDTNASARPEIARALALGNFKDRFGGAGTKRRKLGHVVAGRKFKKGKITRRGRPHRTDVNQSSSSFRD